MGHRGRWCRQGRPVVRSRHRFRHRPGLNDAGQAAVEFALCLPLVVVLVLGLVQVAVVARDQLAIEFAAREGARAAAVSAAPAAAARAAVD
ncbi:MAG: TadE/TadG family type IV pilus assembly protein, partial [Ilumatobacteraceae bacterium]